MGLTCTVNAYEQYILQSSNLRSLLTSETELMTALQYLSILLTIV